MCLMFCCIVRLFFFFKQKTAYEVRISDWSSDVCSSDLASPLAGCVRSIVQILVIAAPSAVWLIGHHISPQQVQYRKNAEGRLLIRQRKKIGRASCRERVCQSV